MASDDFIVPPREFIPIWAKLMTVQQILDDPQSTESRLQLCLRHLDELHDNLNKAIERTEKLANDVNRRLPSDSVK